MIRGHAGVGNKKCRSGEASNAAPDDMGVFFGYSIRRKRVDTIVISHAGILHGGGIECCDKQIFVIA